jgi:3-methyladenine DNA glycosylase AlkD
MIKFSEILKEEQITPQQFQKIDKINKISGKISINAYDFIINQFSRYGIDIADKKKLRNDIDSAISSEIIVDF